MLQKTALWALSVITFLVVAMYIAFQVSPWPSVLYHRHYGRFRQIIDHGWFGLQRTLERYAVTARLDERFDTNDPDAVLDVYYPSEVANTDRKLPTIAWVHGGGFTSGSKDGVAHYLTVLAAKITRSSASITRWRRARFIRRRSCR
jgi:acetyl esterase/lipase